MSLRATARREHPNFPWLDPDRRDELEEYLSAAGFLGHDERVTSCEPAGSGNMNLTLWIETPKRRFVIKQSRPWVEKFDHIAAPWDRTRFEARFYEKAATLSGVGDRMPALLGSDFEARVLILEAIPDSTDLTFFYGYPVSGERAAELSNIEIRELAEYLAALHGGTRDVSTDTFANHDMRELNFDHIFVVPYQEENGVELEHLETGLTHAATTLREDLELREVIAGMGERYLKNGACLIHGDYFPGSWLRSPQGLRIIDPEFGFIGEPEIDLGCAVAHLALIGESWGCAKSLLQFYEQAGSSIEIRTGIVAQYAAAEVIRRLIGVAQLPIPVSTAEATHRNRRKDLLARTRQALLEEECTALFVDQTCDR